MSPSSNLCVDASRDILDVPSDSRSAEAPPRSSQSEKEEDANWSERSQPAPLPDPKQKAGEPDDLRDRRNGLEETADRLDRSSTEFRPRRRARRTRGTSISCSFRCIFCSVAGLFDFAFGSKSIPGIKSIIVWRIWKSWMFYMAYLGLSIISLTYVSLHHGKEFSYYIRYYVNVVSTVYAAIAWFGFRRRRRGVPRNISLLSFEIYSAVFAIQVLLSITCLTTFGYYVYEAVGDFLAQRPPWGLLSLTILLAVSALNTYIHARNSIFHFVALNQLYHTGNGTNSSLRKSIKVILREMKNYEGAITIWLIFFLFLYPQSNGKTLEFEGGLLD